MPPVGVGIDDGAAVAFPGAPLGAVPPEPAAAHAVVASSSAAVTASSADRMALTS
jgi:hypothetical protein